MWLWLQRQQRIDPDDRRGLTALQQRTQGADRQDLTEELELQLLAPLGVGRIGESGNARLARIVDEQVEAAAAPIGDFGSEGVHRTGIENVAAFGQGRAGLFAVELCLGSRETVTITAADCDF